MNSRHFIDLISDSQIEPDGLLICFHVTSTFTNMGIIHFVISQFMEENSEYAEVCALRKQCLTSTYLTLEDQFYKQTSGVAEISPI